ncbi:MAG: PQ-loop domain-containing transporter [Promethearchaeota archaeon]|jgi:uncharacterized protein with PQ loop repeat
MKQIAYLAIIISCIAYMPFIYNVYKTKNAECIDYAWLYMLLATDVLWIIYSIQHWDLPTLLSALIHMNFYILILIMKYNYDSDELKPKVESDRK